MPDNNQPSVSDPKELTCDSGREQHCGMKQERTNQTTPVDDTTTTNNNNKNDPSM